MGKGIQCIYRDSVRVVREGGRLWSIDVPTAVTARELIGPALAVSSGESARRPTRQRDDVEKTQGPLRAVASGLVMLGEAVLVAFSVPIAILAVGLPVAWCVRLLLALFGVR